MAYQRPKDSSEVGDECRLLPAPELGARRAKREYLRLTTGCLALLLLILTATNAATAIYLSKSRTDTQSHTYSTTYKGLSNLNLQSINTNKLPLIPLKSVGQRSKP